jgi:hypothetical protein
VKFNFPTLLWAAIAVLELVLVVARMFLLPSPLRLAMGLSIPGLILLAAIANAIYNRLTTGHMLEGSPGPHLRRH